MLFTFSSDWNLFNPCNCRNVETEAEFKPTAILLQLYASINSSTFNFDGLIFIIMILIEIVSFTEENESLTVCDYV